MVKSSGSDCKVKDCFPKKAFWWIITLIVASGLINTGMTAWGSKEDALLNQRLASHEVELKKQDVRLSALTPILREIRDSQIRIEERHLREDRNATRQM